MKVDASDASASPDCTVTITDASLRFLRLRTRTDSEKINGAGNTCNLESNVI